MLYHQGYSGGGNIFPEQTEVYDTAQSSTHLHLSKKLQALKLNGTDAEEVGVTSELSCRTHVKLNSVQEKKKKLFEQQQQQHNRPRRDLHDASAPRAHFRMVPLSEEEQEE